MKHRQYTTDEVALLRAIAASPEEDTPRLMLADYWTEHGDGTDRARAHYVRHSIDLDRGPVSGVSVYDDTHRRTLRILCRRYGRHWVRGLQCPDCLGWGYTREMVVHTENVPCPTCDGEGDVGGLTDAAADPGIQPLRLEWQRGFPFRVYCSLARVVRTDVAAPGPVVADQRVWEPTPWALRVVTYHPITELVPADKRPSTNSASWFWYDETNGGPDVLRFPAVVPTPIFVLLPGKRDTFGDRTAVGYRTEEAATTALARVLGRYVRGERP